MLDCAGPKRKEVTGGLRKLHNQALYNLCSLPCIVTVIKSRRMCAVHVACMGEMRNTCRILLWKPEGKSPHGRPRHILEGDDIKMDLRETVCERVDWIHLAVDRDR
jgi:hypothetical protein